jgi:hypothetical protein
LDIIELESESGNISDNLELGNQEDSQETNIDDSGYNNFNEAQQNQQSLSNNCQLQSVGDVTVSPLFDSPVVPDACKNSLMRYNAKDFIKLL